MSPTSAHHAITALMLVFAVQICIGQDFAYSGDLGPSHWGEKYSSCIGKHQSPIDISEHNINMVKLDPLYFENFEQVPDSATLTNNGHTVMLKVVSPKLPELSGGPLSGLYRFEQLHFHWGENDFEGSENTINNNSFPMELHMVFYKTEYENFQEAMQHPDGLTVLAFLYQVTEVNNTNYNSILDALHNVEDPSTTVDIPNPVDFNSLLMKNRKQYFTYDGSLTTPPCSEVVIWIEFKNPIGLSHEQLEFFRSLNNEDGKMTHNFRPTQPLYDRIIYYNSDEEPDDIDDNTIDNNVDGMNSRSNVHHRSHGRCVSSSISVVSFAIFVVTLFSTKV